MSIEYPIAVIITLLLGVAATITTIAFFVAPVMMRGGKAKVDGRVLVPITLAALTVMALASFAQRVSGSESELTASAYLVSYESAGLGDEEDLIKSPSGQSFLRSVRVRTRATWRDQSLSPASYRVAHIQYIPIATRPAWRWVDCYEVLVKQNGGQAPERATAPVSSCKIVYEDEGNEAWIEEYEVRSTTESGTFFGIDITGGDEQGNAYLIHLPSSQQETVAGDEK